LPYTTLFRSIRELLEGLGAAEGALHGVVPPGSDQGRQVGLPGIHLRAGGIAGRAADRHEGVAHRDHALPAPALEGGSVGVVQDANGDIAVSLLALLLEDVEVGA